MPAVSVIIPTYNQATYLRGAIDSVLAQTWRDYEIIVVDDGSTDNTREVLEPWIRAGTVQYEKQENKGQAGASNTGLNRATGALAAYLDSDDLWLPDKLEWQVKYLEEHPDVGVIGGGHHFIDEAGRITEHPFFPEGETPFEKLFAQCPFVSIGETMIRTQLLRNAGGFDESIWAAQDLDLWLKLAKGTKIVNVPRLALYYRLHSANSSGNALRMYENCERVVRKHLRDVPSRLRADIACRAFHWLYEYRGQRVILECKRKLRGGEPPDLFRCIRVVMRLFAVAIHDRHFLKQLCGDVFPARFFK